VHSLSIRGWRSASIRGIAENLGWVSGDKGLSRRLNGTSALYIGLLIPGSILAYAGLLWVGASGRGWRTQVAAAALVAAWLALAIGGLHTWALAKLGSTASGLSRTAFLLGALLFYVIAAVWGGRMLI
jgi:hypothetical protein